MNFPLIGVTSERTVSALGSPYQGIGEAYTQAIIQAGASPVLIPTGLPEKALPGLLARLDGLLLTGGGDVHPRFYRSEEHPLIAGIDVERDRLEIELATAAAEAGLPLLGICRGLQVINVALGGSLYADLGNQHPGALPHSRYPEKPRDYLAHPIEVSAGSCLAGIMGAGPSDVNSMHHQGICELAPGLQATALAPDGVIEAVELPGHPFALAVQWHPECLLEHEPARALFKAFVNACSVIRDT